MISIPAPAQQPATNPSAAAPPAATPAVPAAPAASPELIQQLLGRIEQLERRDAERAQAVEKTHAETVQRLLGRIQELETKVGALEGGRVLPEIALAPEEGPTTHELEQQIRVAERRAELAEEAAAERERTAARLSVGAAGVQFSSA
ncbi:MAG: hypothetical protein ACKVYV_05380, partial [Limisphaerales bacterium]